MKNGYYLSTYLNINSISYLENIPARHDQNISLWKKSDSKFELVRYWELERITGEKQQERGFFDKSHAEFVISNLIKEFDLEMDDIVEIWGTPLLDKCSYDYTSIIDFPEYAYHNICHIFSSVLADYNKFKTENILVFSVDGAPDNIIDTNTLTESFYSACYFEKGMLKKIQKCYSPALLWTILKDRYQLREGSLMALASASRSECYYEYDCNDFLISCSKDIGKVALNMMSMMDYIDELSENDLGVKFNCFDDDFSEQENKISMAAKIVQNISYDIMSKNISNMLKFNIVPEQTILSIVGGFALNCPCNAKMTNDFSFKEFSSVPCVNDTGMSLGIAAYVFYKRASKETDFIIDLPYAGSPDSNYFERLSEYRQFIDTVSPLNTSTFLQDIKTFPIVWFEGNSEIGPRALGHRSILADPTREKTKDILNQIKQREWWRPVAPIVLEEYGDKWFDDFTPSKYMLLTYKIKQEKRNKIPAIAHLDDSARVQSINKSDDEMLYNVLSEFYKATGVPILCNTSLNDKGEPIIETISEMLNFACRKRIPIVYIDGIRVKLKNQNLFSEKSPHKRPLNFNNYMANEEKEKLRKKMGLNFLTEAEKIVLVENYHQLSDLNLQCESDRMKLKKICSIKYNKHHII